MRQISGFTVVQIGRYNSVGSLAWTKLVGCDHFRQLATAAKVKPVNAGSKMVASGLHAVPRKHAHAGLAGGLAEAAQRLNLAILT